MVGRTLAHFRITGRLGAGGMGEVYRAEDTTLKRPVALKILPAEVTGDPARLARFRREAESLAALSHENIVTIHSIGEDAGRHFLAMELVEGQTLDKRLSADGMPLDALLDAAIPLVDALAAAHEREIVHRDLKPANVMLTEDGKVKVLDFGLAKLGATGGETAVDALPPAAPTATATLLETREGVVMGTMPYMSPEQISGKPVGAASDLFSVGVLLYEMATGRRPFSGATSPELMSGILKDVPAPVSEIRPGLPKALSAIIRRCLEKRPEDRFGSAAELREALVALRDRTSGPGRTRRRLALVVSAALLSVVAGVTAWRELRPRPDRPASAPIRLAVLPFDTDGAPDNRFVGDGIAEEIALRLAGLRGMGVVPFASTLGYRDTDRGAGEIGRELGIDYVLDGAVEWAAGAGSALRVTPRLVRVSDGGEAWSRVYDTDASAVLELQSDISEQVVRALDVTLSGKERERLRSRPTDNPLAYDAYLRGLEVLPEGHAPEAEYRKARSLFGQAVTLDPEFTLAWARLSDAERGLYFFGYDRTEARLERAWEAIQRAAELAPDLGDVRRTLGDYHYQGHLDYARALAEYSRAVQDLPNDPDLLRAVAYIWRRQGLIEQALKNMERALALSPSDPYQRGELAYTLSLVGRFDPALDHLDQVIEIAPDLEWGHLLKALVYWCRGEEGDLPLARAALERYPDRRSSYPAWFWIRQELFEGRHDAALTRIANLPTDVLKLQARVEPRSMLRGLVQRILGDEEAARASLEDAAGYLEAELRALPDDHRLRAALGLTYAGLGRAEDAIREGERAVELYPVTEDALMGPDRVWDLARIYALVGEHERALDRIAYLLSIPSIYSPAMIRQDPWVASLRDHPRFASLLEGEGGD
jgi:TolB-like protein/Flp pilus assembly protein TadD